MSATSKEAESRSRLKTRLFPAAGTALALACAVVAGFACGAPRFDSASSVGKGGIIDAANIALTNGDCATAIHLIEPLYESDASDDQVRFVRASAHACAMGLEFFSTVVRLGSMNLLPPFFWQTVSEVFYDSSLSDSQLYSKQASGGFAIDALMAILERGVVVPGDFKINADTSNPGSVDVNHRTEDSSFYMLFTSLALMSHTQNRRGDPDPDDQFVKRQDLPWITGDSMTEEGCAYAGAVLTFFDSAGAVGNAMGGDLAQSLLDSRLQYSSFLTQACMYGCLGNDDGGPDEDPGCAALSLTCTSCNKAIRNREACMASDETKCAAAGLIRFINGSTINGSVGGWQN